MVGMIGMGVLGACGPAASDETDPGSAGDTDLPEDTEEHSGSGASTDPTMTSASPSLS